MLSERGTVPEKRALKGEVRIVIRELREKLGWSQNELARRSGVKQGVLSEIESGVTKNPRVATMAAIAAALNVTIDELIKKGDRTC